MAQMSGPLSENLIKNEGLTRLRYKRISNTNIAMEEPGSNSGSVRSLLNILHW